ncbi:hypothetical protein BDV28DRAFT_143014 [Aspergillus coremiiformis]|uniref:Protein kinase domain-containing protein n=1 Tax=Aspergillus coremiiformis TaxID=138285 RepID=A0A5N6YVJ6_9EURO|nr:hypothetical protein BDV28DRAFT_143014 [Aspergillus coremiiformis]
MQKISILRTDFTPRNIILVNDAYLSGKRNVVFLDFAGALFGRTRDDATYLRPRLFLGTFIPPLLRWGRRPRDFKPWADWNW